MSESTRREELSSVRATECTANNYTMRAVGHLLFKMQKSQKNQVGFLGFRWSCVDRVIATAEELRSCPTSVFFCEFAGCSSLGVLDTFWDK